jgi:serine/threonine-protein kinase
MSAAPTTHLSDALKGRYEVGHRLGEGATASVYLAKDLRHGRSVAIKVLHPDLVAAVGAERFLKEIRTTANLQHPHIVPLFDSGQAGEYLFYVMPYVAGRTLKERLEVDPRTTVDEAIEIVSRVAEALHYAHRQGVLHRDVKPGNILLSPEGPMLSDFGIARALGEAVSDDSLRSFHNSGTPQYMSLEQLAGDVSLDARSDLYSLACVLFEMLAGEPPHRAKTPFALLRKRIEEPPQRISRLRPDVPEHVADVLAKALERDRHERLDSVIEFARELRKSTAQLVLFPIANASRLGEHDWFSDALSVEIRHRLSAIQGLKVVQADAAYEQGSSAPLLPVVKKLRGSHALVGSTRFHDGSYTISVQLINADGTELWSGQFDEKLTSPSRFTVQDQIASEVVHRLPGSLRLRVFSAGRPSPEAEPLFWEAQSAWQSRSTDKLLAAESLFKQAIEADPAFARAWVGLARVYVVLGGADYATHPPSELYPRAREAADRALELDPDLWEAHAVLGNCAMCYDWDWEAAEGHFREAIERNASYASGLQWYSNFMMYRGRSDEAFELAHRALATSDSKYLRSSLARHYAVVGEPRIAIEKYEEALEMDRGFRSALIGLAFAKLQAGDIEAFLRDVAAMTASVARRTGPSATLPLLEAMRAHGLGKLGRSDEAMEIIDSLEPAAREPRAPWRPYVPPEFLALAYIGHGDHAHALDWLERAAAVKSHIMSSIMVEPVLAPLRGEPRFTRLLELGHGPLERLGPSRG